MKASKPLKPTKPSFTMLELVFVIVILSIMAISATMYVPHTELQQASDYLINNMKYAKSLAQTDDRYYTSPGTSPGGTTQIAASQVENWQRGMWQVQFHLKGDIVQNSYSIYADAGRTNAPSTDLDGKPMSKEDSIAKSPHSKACLTGYNDNNLPDECKNNRAKEVRLEQTYEVVIKSIDTQPDCKSAQTARIFFGRDGMPYCQDAKKTIVRLTQPVVITLERKKQTATICVSTGGLIYGSNTGVCDK